MKIKFWGVRGSIPAPGPETNRYGGNTACVSVTTASGGLVIIDMGTGLMHLGNALMASAFGKGQGKATILLSHTHWDHIQGLGFFPPVFVPGNQFTVWGPGDSSKILEQILEGQMDPNFSPLQTLKNLAASFDVSAVACGTPFSADGLTISAREHPHGATKALAFRIEEYATELQSRKVDLESLLAKSAVEVRDHPDDAMLALIEETHKMAAVCAPKVRDAALAASVQRIIHYKIAGYGTIASYAKVLGHLDEAGHFAQLADRDKAIDAELTELAKATLNPGASHSLRIEPTPVTTH